MRAGPEGRAGRGARGPARLQAASRAVGEVRGCPGPLIAPSSSDGRHLLLFLGSKIVVCRLRLILVNPYMSTDT